MKYKWASEKKRNTQKLKEEKGEYFRRKLQAKGHAVYVPCKKNLVLKIATLFEMLYPYILYFRIKL
jgi:hypothetical protein